MDNQLIREMVETHGTPAYLFDTDLFGTRIENIRKIMGGRADICYAMKANPFLTEVAAKSADSLEVCSHGEYSICRQLLVDADKLVLSGVNKDKIEILEVMRESGVGTYTAESLQQLFILESCAMECDLTRVPVLIRLSSGNQFGMDEDTVYDIVANRRRYAHLEFVGIQFYSGTQKKKLDKIKKELCLLDAFCTQLKEKLDFTVHRLEYGPGFFISYFQGEEKPDENKILTEFKNMLDTMGFQGKIVLELGRFLAAPCGSYVTSIADTKIVKEQNYCILDGGINHINYYGQAMAMKIPDCRYLPPNEETAITQEEKIWMLCGSLCTAGDILVKNFPMRAAEIGGLIVFDCIGAYSVTEGIYLFLSRRLPRVILYSKMSGARLVRKDIPTYPINTQTMKNI